MLFVMTFCIQRVRVKQSKRQNRQKEWIKIVEIKRMHKVKEKRKKLLTKAGESGRIVKLSQRAAAKKESRG